MSHPLNHVRHDTRGSHVQCSLDQDTVPDTVLQRVKRSRDSARVRSFTTISAINIQINYTDVEFFIRRIEYSSEKNM